MIEQILIEYRGTLTAFGVAFISILVTLYIYRRRRDDVVINKFTNVLSKDVAALSAYDNINCDAFDILSSRFTKHYEFFIPVYASSSFIRKRRLMKAWKTYYGEDGEQEWWLPNEYSTIQSNQLKNTSENTKNLAIHRITKLIKLCK
jgi:hypothetical protein